MINPELTEAMAGLAFIIGHKNASKADATKAAQQAYEIIDRNIGVQGHARFETISFETVARVHDAMIEAREPDETLSNLADKFWRRVTVGKLCAPSPS